MTTILLCRDSAAGRALAGSLVADGLIAGVVLETGRTARRRKLGRMLRGPWWRLPLRLLDVLALAVYSCAAGRAFRALPESATWPTAVPLLAVDDVNEEACIAWIVDLLPDVIVVYGCSILKKPLLTLPRKFVLNVHGGILPHYRNVHSDFRAMAAQDYQGIGTTIAFLDEGIDTGDIALSARVQVEPEDTIGSIKRKNLALAGHLAAHALHLARADRLPRSPQDHAHARFHPSPGLRDLTLFLLRRRYRVNSHAER